MKNPVTYYEIPVSNLHRAIDFYSSVFDFQFEQSILDGNEMAFFLIMMAKVELPVLWLKEKVMCLVNKESEFIFQVKISKKHFKK